jgi:hypothetical protein
LIVILLLYFCHVRCGSVLLLYVCLHYLPVSAFAFYAFEQNLPYTVCLAFCTAPYGHAFWTIFFAVTTTCICAMYILYLCLLLVAYSPYTTCIHIHVPNLPFFHGTVFLDISVLFCYVSLLLDLAMPAFCNLCAVTCYAFMYICVILDWFHYVVGFCFCNLLHLLHHIITPCMPCCASGQLPGPVYCLRILELIPCSTFSHLSCLLPSYVFSSYIVCCCCNFRSIM